MKIFLLGSVLAASILFSGCESACCQKVPLTQSVVDEKGNQTPIPVITDLPAKAECGIVLNGSGANSTDPDGEIVDYAWTLDNQPVTGENLVATTLPCDGKNHEVCLTVTDNKGASQTTCQTIFVVEPQPQPQPEPQPEPQSQDHCDQLIPKITYEKADAMQYKFHCTESTYNGVQIDLPTAATCEWNAHKTFQDNTSYDHGTVGPVKWINVDPEKFKSLDLTLTVKKDGCEKTITEHYILPNDLPY